MPVGSVHQQEIRETMLLVMVEKELHTQLQALQPSTAAAAAVQPVLVAVLQGLQ